MQFCEMKLIFACKATVLTKFITILCSKKRNHYCKSDRFMPMLKAKLFNNVQKPEKRLCEVKMNTLELYSYWTRLTFLWEESLSLCVS